MQKEKFKFRKEMNMGIVILSEYEVFGTTVGIYAKNGDQILDILIKKPDGNEICVHMGIASYGLDQHISYILEDSLKRWHRHFSQNLADMYESGHYESLPNWSYEIVDKFDIKVTLDPKILFWNVELNGNIMFECLSVDELMDLKMSDIVGLKHIE